MHPDEWASTDAERWNYYFQLRNAYEEGAKEVRDKFESRKRSEANAAKGMDALIKKHGGAATF